MSIIYNPYNWKIKGKKEEVERKYEENFNKIIEKGEKLRKLREEINIIEGEIIELGEENFELLMSDDITFDFLLSRIK